MKQIFIILTCCIFTYQGLSQELKKIKNQISLNLTEYFYVQKQDKKIRHGEYILILGNDTIQKGVYTNGIKSGDWKYMKKGKTEFIYNYDSGIMVSDTVGKPRGVIYSEGSVFFDVMIAREVVYPIKAMQNRNSGTVLISFNINTDGSASDFLVEKSCKYLILDEEALKVVKKVATQSPWHPAINQEGEKYKATIVRPIHFILQPVSNPGSSFRFIPGRF